MLVTIGAQHAIGLIGRTLLSRGDRALVESPTLSARLGVAPGARRPTRPVAVSTDAGWDEPGFEQAIQRSSPTLGYLMPDFHNPTGRSMPAELRERIAALGRRRARS